MPMHNRNEQYVKRKPHNFNWSDLQAFLVGISGYWMKFDLFIITYSTCHWSLFLRWFTVERTMFLGSSFSQYIVIFNASIIFFLNSL